VLANIDTRSAANMQFGGWSKLQAAESRTLSPSTNVVPTQHGW
jgi:hypothetical protein